MESKERSAAAACSLCIFGVIAVAAFLQPDPRGIGTHQQLGLPPCATATFLGIPCPFCGMTTAFSHMAHGDISSAFIVQPAGALGFFLAIAAGFTLAIASASGRGPANWEAVPRSRWILGPGIAVLALAWVYKIAAYTGIGQP